MSTFVEIATPTDAEDIRESRSLWQDIALEYAGTLLFVYISLAGVNQVVLSGADQGFVNQLQISLCFAAGLSSGIIVAGRSGGHLNPAVSFVSYLTNPNFSSERFVGYVVAQLCGGFTAGLLVLAVYYSWMSNFPNVDVFIGSFGTLKNSQNSLISAIVDQFIGSALLMFGICTTPDSWSKPITIGAILGALGLFQGTNGFAFNLARDFGPRAASVVVFGWNAMSAGDYWLWVPAVVPFAGATLGCYLAYIVKSIQ